MAFASASTIRGSLYRPRAFAQATRTPASASPASASINGGTAVRSRVPGSPFAASARTPASSSFFSASTRNGAQRRSFNPPNCAAAFARFAGSASCIPAAAASICAFVAAMPDRLRHANRPTNMPTTSRLPRIRYLPTLQLVSPYSSTTAAPHHLYCSPLPALGEGLGVRARAGARNDDA
ncbi:MAG: hypothetical protein BWY76_02144 [bacterium ADurb.Bin429]|nr:MAG: hypothetical protein BWY76_02144 [bacterium ADurb.Bin429]